MDMGMFYRVQFSIDEEKDENKRIVEIEKIEKKLRGVNNIFWKDFVFFSI